MTTVLRTDFVASLSHFGLISVSGEEAADFLHKQLTHDILHLPDNQARLAGYCSPKGRMLASLLVWKSGEQIFLQIPRDIQESVQKRLSMFILRSKVALHDASEEHVALGLCGSAADAALLPWFSSLPQVAYEKTETENGVLIRHHDAFDAPRYQWITTPEKAVKVWPHLTSLLQATSEHAWKWAEIASGIPHISMATQEKFVPQMVNFELVGGVSFKKGCYPGQEIVARSQYLGKAKRRMMYAHVEAKNVMAGTEIFSLHDPAQPCGMVVNAVQVTHEKTDCLVEIKLASSETPVRLGSVEGPVLSFSPLPYSLVEAT